MTENQTTTKPLLKFKDLQFVAETHAEGTLLEGRDRFTSPHITVRVEDIDAVLFALLGYEYPSWSPLGELTQDEVERRRKRYHRMEMRLMKAALGDWIENGNLEGIALSDEPDLRFRRKAGCSCGCSPAFIDRNKGTSRLAEPQYVSVKVLVLSEAL